MTSIQTQFQHTVDHVNNTESTTKPSPADQLEIYSLYKQASQGDVTGNAPSMLNPIGRAKHKAWAEKKGLSQEEAMQAYIQKIESMNINAT